MEHHKEIEINGCIEIPMEMTEDEFYDKFFGFLEENNWSFGGGTCMFVDGHCVDSDGTREEYALKDED